MRDNIPDEGYTLLTEAFGQSAICGVEQACQYIVNDLEALIDQDHQAILAVCGGRSPLALFAALCQQDIAWASVLITLIDERDVPADHPDSNAGLVAKYLRQHKAQQAQWVPLKDFATTTLVSSPKADIAVIGLGEDGHFASLFPAMIGQDQFFSSQVKPEILYTPPMGTPEHPRITMNLSLLLQSSRLLLMVAGVNKARVLCRAVGDASLPLYHLLKAAHPHMTIVYQS